MGLHFIIQISCVCVHKHITLFAQIRIKMITLMEFLFIGYRYMGYAFNIALNMTNTFFLFYCSTRMGEHTLSAGTSDKRMYWLSQLQRARREFSQAGAAAAAKSSMACQVQIFNPCVTKIIHLK